MKKFLTWFGAVGLTVTATTTVIACGDKDSRILSEVISTQNLGAIEAKGATPTTEEVIKGIKAIKANSSLKEAEVTVSAITATSAKVTVKDGSTVYDQGSVDVTFTVKLPDLRVELNTVLKTKSVGEITTSTGQAPTTEQVMEAIVKANAGLNTAEVKIDSITNRGAKVSVKENSTVYKGKAIDVTFVVKDARPELGTVIGQKALGQINQAGSMPTSEEVIAAIKKPSQNKGLNEKEVTVSAITATSATVTVNNGSTVYQPGSLKVTYTLDKRTELSTGLTVTDLGEIETDGAAPTSEQILVRAKEKNPNLNRDSLRVTNITETSARIRATGASTAYKPNSFVDVTFTI